MPLPRPEHRQHVRRQHLRGRVQRVPAVRLRPGHHLPADNGPDRLLGVLALQHRLRFGQADLLGRGADVAAGFLLGHEQATGQLLPAPQPVRVAAGPHGHVQARVLGRDQVPQGPHPRVALPGPGVEEGVQVRRPAAAQGLAHQGHRQVDQPHVPGVARTAR